MEINALRRDVYNYLSLCFDYPSDSLVGEASSIASSLSALAGMGLAEELAEGVDLLIDALAGLADVDGARLLELQVEYSRLFVGPYKPKVYACESVFTNRNIRAETFSQELAHAYRKEGLKLSADFKDLPDHISPELEFMSHLCGREAEAGAVAGFDYQLEQRSFMGEHLANWVPAFAEEVERAASVDFYKALARVMRLFLLWDRKRLEANAVAAAGR